MLVETQNEAWAFELLGQIEPGFPHAMNAHRGWPENAGKHMALLVDDLNQPQAFALCRGAHFFMLGTNAGITRALADIYHGRIEQQGGWPDEAARKQWAQAGPRYVELELPGLNHYETARSLGFHVREVYYEYASGAYFYYTFGRPRYADEVKHSCRVVEGLELFELMRQGVDYDPKGEYIKRCLEDGPSFVCEVDGEPVCWSCTHLNRCMGMIYTPPQHRRKGYARSLAAFQLDTMLELDGTANCFVLTFNTPSQNMCNSLGMTRCPLPMVWRTATWRAPRRRKRGRVQNLLAG